MSEKLIISKAEATAFTIDGIRVELWWEAGTHGAYDKAVSTCLLLQKVPKMIELLEDQLNLLDQLLHMITWKKPRAKILRRKEKIESLLKELES